MTIGLLRVLLEDDGAALVEYGMVTAAIALASIGVLQLMGISLNSVYGDVTAKYVSSARSGQ